MNKRNHDNRIPLRMLGVLVALSLLASACGISKAEINTRLDVLREEPILTTPPPDAILIGEFKSDPIVTALGAIRTLGRVMTLWATTATVEGLEEWYTTEFGGTYEFASLRVRGGFDLADTQSSVNSIRVGIRFPELTMLPELGGQTFNQDTHPGMTFVLARAGERDNFGDGG